MATKRIRVVPTDMQFFFQKCPYCNGSGRCAQTVDGWWIDYHYQDGHEQSGPKTKEQAAKEYFTYDHSRSIAPLIGPDGKIYKVEEIK